MKMSNTDLADLRFLISIGYFTVLALLLVSWDSYLYDLPHHHDVIWYYYPMLMSQYEKPRVLYLNCHDHGESVPVMGSKSRSMQSCAFMPMWCSFGLTITR